MISLFFDQLLFRRRMLLLPGPLESYIWPIKKNLHILFLKLLIFDSSDIYVTYISIEYKKGDEVHV
ncbi:MAG TPA: hypothetical protein DDW53_03535 [Lachnoclostridium sp.]|nr:hypothetical protein [Lachnoclostridium sp.]